MATIDVKDASNATVAVEKPNANGRAAATSSRPVVLSNEDKQALDDIAANTATLATADPAHGAADTGNPVKTGGRSVAGLSGQTPVDANDRTDALFSLDGAQFVRRVPLEDLVRGVAAITDGSSTSVISAAGSGVKIYVTSISIANSSATSVTVDLRDGTAGSVLATFSAPAGGGCVLNLGDCPIAFSANTAVAADPSAAASTVTVTLVGFKSKI